MDTLQRRFHQSLVAAQQYLGLLFGTFAFGDVAAQRKHKRPVFKFHGSATDLDMDRRAILAPVDSLKRSAAAILDELFPARQQFFS